MQETLPPLCKYEYTNFKQTYQIKSNQRLQVQLSLDFCNGSARIVVQVLIAPFTFCEQERAAFIQRYVKVGSLKLKLQSFLSLPYLLQMFLPVLMLLLEKFVLSFNIAEISELPRVDLILKKIKEKSFKDKSFIIRTLHAACIL